MATLKKYFLSMIIFLIGLDNIRAWASPPRQREREREREREETEDLVTLVSASRSGVSCHLPAVLR